MREADGMTVAEFRKLMTTVAAGWNEGDARKAAGCFADDAIYSEPGNVLMNIKLLLIVTAVIELATGAALLITPSLAAELLLGTRLGSPESVLVGRVAGAALFSIGLICWLERDRDRYDPRTGLVLGLLAYNVSILVLLAYAAVVENMHGIALWPAAGLHSALSVWCVACLRSSRSTHPRASR